MQGHDEVISLLNDVLSAELTAINQYFAHAMICKNWRYQRLAEHSRKESLEEMKHAQELIERILYLDGIPNVSKYMKINVGNTIPKQHEFDLALEKEAATRLNEGIQLCRTQKDNGSRILLEKILHDEEEHIDWLEAQLQQIQDIGLDNYLAQQLGD